MTFIVGRDGVYAAHPWPRVLRMAPEMLNRSKMCSLLANGLVLFCLANGSATYEKMTENQFNDEWLCRLRSSVFSPDEEFGVLS